MQISYKIHYSMYFNFLVLTVNILLISIEKSVITYFHHISINLFPDLLPQNWMMIVHV